MEKPKDLINQIENNKVKRIFAHNYEAEVARDRQTKELEKRLVVAQEAQLNEDKKFRKEKYKQYLNRPPEAKKLDFRGYLFVYHQKDWENILFGEHQKLGKIVRAIRRVRSRPQRRTSRR